MKQSECRGWNDPDHKELVAKEKKHAHSQVLFHSRTHSFPLLRGEARGVWPCGSHAGSGNHVRSAEQGMPGWREPVIKLPQNIHMSVCEHVHGCICMRMCVAT